MSREATWTPCTSPPTCLALPRGPVLVNWHRALIKPPGEHPFPVPLTSSTASLATSSEPCHLSPGPSSPTMAGSVPKTLPPPPLPQAAPPAFPSTPAHLHVGTAGTQGCSVVRRELNMFAGRSLWDRRLCWPGCDCPTPH